MMPIMQEYLPAKDSNAVTESLKMVDKADIYILILAYRYGYIPDGYNTSITQLEYQRAIEQKKTRLVFLMKENQANAAQDGELAEKIKKLKEFRKLVSKDRVVGYFDSPEDLRSEVIDSLSQHREPEPESVHFFSDIPAPPEPYIAHPYTLLQSQDLIGREDELGLLSDWITRAQPKLSAAQIFSVVSIGGMGKSAFTWKWFNEIAKQYTSSLNGYIWWSFYESDASFSNFIIRTLAYITKTKIGEIEKLEPTRREDFLLQILKNKKYLIVLDGLERILLAYARMDAAHLSDEDLDSKKDTKHQAIEGADNIESRFLISTRLYPSILQDNVTKKARHGNEILFLKGLKDEDAIKLWRTFGVSGDQKSLKGLFNTFDNYPMLIRSLAAEIANYRKAPGDFEKWHKANSDFNPFQLPLVQVKSHVLSYSLKGLSKIAYRVLHTIAAFRTPVVYDILASLLVGESKILKNEKLLDQELMDLEERGLIGWNRGGNRYDMHPIVRGVTWSGIDTREKKDIYTAMESHFESIPSKSNWEQVKSVDELTIPIEHYNTLIRLNSYDRAYTLFYDSLNSVTNYKLNANRLRIELLEALFPEGVKGVPTLTKSFEQAFTLNALALSYDCYGQPLEAMNVYNILVSKLERDNDEHNLSICLSNLHE
jgi:hypothetical protein